MNKLLALLLAVGPALVGAGHYVPGNWGAALSIVGVAVTGLAGLFHPSPQAISTYGAAAK